MRNVLLLGIFCLTLFACPQNTTKNPISNPTDNNSTTFSTVIKIPKGYKKLAEVNGDLDKDGINEKVFVFDTPHQEEMGTQREVRIYLKGVTGWKLWHKAKNVVLPSEHGGMMGDPFQDLRIERGCVVIDHYGGSRQKWSYTHRYRYQKGDWRLIGATNVSDAPCESIATFDYNLVTGRVNFQKDHENCRGDERVVAKTDKETFVDKRQTLPQMGKFSFEKIYAVSPKTGKCFPEVACYDYDAKSGGNEEGIHALTGVYTLGGHDESWALIIQPKGNNMEIRFLEIDGMLPPSSDFKAFFARNKGQVLNQFDVDFSDMSFESDLGYGEIVSSPDDQTITFFDKESHIDDQLDLIKNESLSYLVE